MKADRSFDVIVVGGGTMGTAAAWALAKRGLKPLVLEQFQHIHDKGSHGGETRVIRHAYAESPEYVPLVRQADEQWQELERQCGQSILVRCGGVELAAPGRRHARAARASADEHGLVYEWLPPVEVNRRWPGIRVPEDWDALYSPDSGFLVVEPALRSMADAAKQLGASFVEHVPVLGWSADASGLTVETQAMRYSADALVVTAGAWARALLKDLDLPLEVRRKTLWWQRLDDIEPYKPERFPIFITDSSAGEIYGFPVFGTPGLKIANHQGGDEANPDTVDRRTKPGENADCLELAGRVLPGVQSEVVKSVVCLYTVTPDGDFIVDRHPDDRRIAIAAGFSGHGFKFAPAIGDFLADLVTTSASPIGRFTVSRFQAIPATSVNRKSGHTRSVDQV